MMIGVLSSTFGPLLRILSPDEIAMRPNVFPSQAVILAGGLGTRLRPLTDTRPKPMIEFHGRPFLEYLVEMLREQGIRRILLLLGYLPEVVIDHFGDGSAFGVEIEYSIGPLEDDTGSRIRRVCDRVDECFLLLYCDNYWPMDLGKLWRSYQAAGTLAQVVVYRNKDGYTKHNLRVENGRVAVYDKTRREPGLAGVDIGFFLLRRSVLDLLPEDGNPSFEKVVYPRLIAEGQLAAFETDHRYYSVGSHERLPLTGEFLARHPAVLLDRDGTINERMGRAQYVCSWDQWHWLPGAREALALLTRAGYRIILITNQPGLARGALKVADLEDIHGRMIAEAAEVGGQIDAIEFCPHNWDEGCECRKPKPGMLFAAQRRFDLDLSRVTFMGDDERDGQAAGAAGCLFVEISEERPLIAAVKELLSSRKGVA